MPDKTQKTKGSKAEARDLFVPARIRDLTVGRHVVVLFCLLVNVYAGWHFYMPLHDNGWGDFDDHTWRRDAERRNTLSTIFDPFMTTGQEGMDTSFVPIQSLIYHWSVNIVEQEAIPVRVVGLWLHVLNSLLVFFLTFRFTRSIPGSHMASLLFLLYPRNASTIGWLCASLAHGLVTLLYLLAFLVLQTFLHRRTWWRLPLAVLIFATAVLTKELGTTLLGAIVLYDLICVRGFRSLWPPKLKVYLGYFARHGAILAVVIAVVIIQKLKYETGFVNTKFGGMEFGWRNPIRLVELATLLFHWGPRWSAEMHMWAMGAISSIWFAGLYLARRKPDLLFLIVWIPVILTPFTISNFRDVQTLGRYVYEASAVLFVLGAALAVRLVRARPFLTWPVLSGAFLLLTSFVLTVKEMVR